MLPTRQCRRYVQHTRSHIDGNTTLFLGPVVHSLSWRVCGSVVVMERSHCGSSDGDILW